MNINWKSNVRPSVSFIGIGFMLIVFFIIAIYARNALSTFDTGFASEQAQAALNQ